jgi:hypothetical protein
MHGVTLMATLLNMAALSAAFLCVTVKHPSWSLMRAAGLQPEP